MKETAVMAVNHGKQSIIKFSVHYANIFDWRTELSDSNRK